jgi:hypothetical protein
VQSWFETAPEEPKISDDKVAMYNIVSRTAIFRALRARAEFSRTSPSTGCSTADLLASSSHVATASSLSRACGYTTSTTTTSST